MNDFKKNKWVGGGRFGKKDFKKPAFGRPGFGRNFDAAPEVYQAVCAQCGKSCEVPFRPNGKKPIYCRDCFAQMNGESKPAFARPFSSDRLSSNRFSSDRRNDRVSADDRKIDGLKRQIEALDAKLEKVLSLVSASAKDR